MNVKKRITNYITNSIFCGFSLHSDDLCSVRKTIISKVHGLYIYKEEIISYQGNAVLCDKVIDFLLENKTIGEFKPKSICARL